MPDSGRFKRLNSVPVLGSATADYLSPFFAKLTDNATPDYTLNENYSGAATDAFYTAPTTLVISSIGIVVGNTTNTPQFTDSDVTFFGITALTNGLKFAVKSGSTVTQDITVTYPLQNAADLHLFSTTSSVIVNASGQATATQNQYVSSFEINCSKKFGGLLLLPSGYKFVCTLQDDLSNLSYFSIAISGYYLN